MRVSAFLGAILFVGGATARPNPNDYFSSDYCYPGQRCYPSLKELASFNSSVGGRLQSDRPIGAVCYRNDPAFNQAACDTLSANSNSTNWRVEHFGSYVYTLSESCGTQMCNATSAEGTEGQTCYQGRIANYALKAQSAQDVQRWAKFVSKYRLRPTIKNTGHDLLARSAGQGGFALWTHEFKSIAFHSTFKPQGCKESYTNAMTLGAGVQWGDAYQAAHEHGRFLVGGAARSVGTSGGWLLGGGHSYNSPAFGTGADNLLEMNIVTADGTLRTINKCSHPDLFFAVRGGGGATWGAVVSVTYRTHAEQQMHVFSPVIPSNLSTETFADIVDSWVAVAPALAHTGVGGAWTLFGRQMGIIVNTQETIANLSTFQAALQPFTQKLSQYRLESGYTTYKHWFDYFSTAVAPEKDSTGGIVGGGPSSVLIPEQLYRENRSVVTSSILKTSAAGGLFIAGLVGPIRFAADTGRQGETSLNPNWYKSIWHVLSDDMASVVSAAALDSAVYFGESSSEMKTPARSYWGEENYSKLLETKMKYDRQNLFQVYNGVASGTLETEGRVAYNQPRWTCYKS